MSGSLITLGNLFFREFEATTGSWQFSGNTSTARLRLAELRRKVYPKNWSDLQRWPVQCECGHTQEFCVAYLITGLRCAICRKSFWSDDLGERMMAAACDLTRWSMLCHKAGGVHALGERDAQVLRVISRIAGNDPDMLDDVAESMDLTRAYRSQA